MLNLSSVIYIRMMILVEPALPLKLNHQSIFLGYHNNNRKVSSDSFALMRYLTESFIHQNCAESDKNVNLAERTRRRPLSMICGGAIKREAKCDSVKKLPICFWNSIDVLFSLTQVDDNLACFFVQSQADIQIDRWKRKKIVRILCVDAIKK